LDRPLDELARAMGVITSYHDIDGNPRHASEDALVAVLRALGAPLVQATDAADALRAVRAAESKVRMEPVHLVRAGEFPSVRLLGVGETAASLTLEREDGSVEEWSAAGEPTWTDAGPATAFPVVKDLPLGVHRLAVDTGRHHVRTTILHAPRLAQPLRNSRTWGVFAPLHAYGDHRTGGVASYTDLERLGRWAASLGASWVSTLPMLSSFLDQPFEPSPYVPASRLFWNDLYIDVTRAPGADPDVAQSLMVPDSGDFVDYRCVADVRRRALRDAAHRFFAAGGESNAAFRSWLGRNSRGTAYARFRALCDQMGTPWPEWPSPLRGGTAVAAAVNPADVRFHAYAAWVAETQIAGVVAAARDGAAQLYLDIPLGVHAAGFDTWHEPALFAAGVSVGAPPDPFFKDGQRWGFPPLSPDALRRDGHRYVRDCLRHHLESAGMLRLDHAMSLERLFWIPDGMPAIEGVYVRYPQDELLALLALESRLHETVLVGEDLGTVTPAIRHGLDSHGILRMYVAQFEFTPWAEPPLARPARNVVASINTHDLPPFAAFWGGLDLDDQFALGLLDAAALEPARQERARLRVRLREWAGAEDLADDAAVHRVLAAILELLAASEAPVVIVNLEDLWLETRPQNVPGTSAERPNWKRRSKRDLAALLDDAAVTAALLHVDRNRRLPHSRDES
jgi:4-alpha-glucanotransferase